MKPGLKIILIGIGLLILLLAAFIGISRSSIGAKFQPILKHLHVLDKNEKPEQVPHSFKDMLLAKLVELEAKNPHATSPVNNTIKIDVSIPLGKPWEMIVWQCDSARMGSSYRVEDCFFDNSKQHCAITYVDTQFIQPKIIVTISRTQRFGENAAQLAILINDFEFKTDQASVDFLAYPGSLTFSLVPTKLHADRTAQMIGEQKKEIIVLISLEPLYMPSSKRDETIIMLHYPDEKIVKNISDALKVVPNFAGMCNRWNSRALEDSRVMQVVLKTAKEHKAWFIDTRENVNSHVSAFAEQLGVPVAAIDVTLKEGQSSAETEKELRHYIPAALKKGKFIIQCNADPSTIDALKNLRVVFERSGLQLVFISDLVEKHPATLPPAPLP
jgi:polysaccharide deacetylase 2 family uncharacterized protein YibQ